MSNKGLAILVNFSAWSLWCYNFLYRFDLMDSLLKRSTAMKKQVSINEWHAQPQRAAFNVKKKIQHLQDQCGGLEGVALADTLAELGVLFLWQQDIE